MEILDIDLNGYVTGICSAKDLDAIDIDCPVKKYDAGKKARDILPECQSVIVIGSPVAPETEIVRKGILADDYPSYHASRMKANEICEALKKNGYKAKTSVGISIKNAAVLSGIGSWGKNALIINPDYGTMLRFCTVLTDFIPQAYSKPCEQDLCKDCKKCIEACPNHCLTPYKIDGPSCECLFIDKNTKIFQTAPMCSICQDVCPYNK